MNFSARVLLTTVAILVLTVGGLTLAADRWLRDALADAFTEELERETRLVATTLPRGGQPFQPAVRRAGTLLGHRVTVIDSTGRVVADSDFDETSLALLENHLDRPEVRDALDRGVGVSWRFSTSTQRSELKVAVRAWPGIVRLSAPPAEIDRVVSGAQRAVFLAAAIALLMGSVLAVGAGRATAQPLRRLAAAARGIAAGESPEYPTGGGPEVRQLVRAFRGMQEQIGARMAELEHRREETETLIASMAEGVIATGPDGEIRVANAASRRLLRYEDDAPLPNVRELFRTVDAREMVDQALAGNAVLGRELTLDDQTVLATARPLPPGGVVLSLLDVTSLRRLETVRRDFVANVSHELKTPLTSISGYAETLLHDEPDPETRRRFLEVIQNNTRRMQHLVDDLLDLARLEAGGWQPRQASHDPAAAAEAAWAPLADRAAVRQVTFQLEVPAGLTAWADGDALRQIFANLLDNALRHTPEGGSITVTGQRQEGGVRLSVRDTGSGIPAEHLSRVFERFYRVDAARSRDQGGTGLGLSIVRHLVEAHGGTVEIESTVGRGTVVHTHLPDRPDD